MSNTTRVPYYSRTGWTASESAAAAARAEAASSINSGGVDDAWKTAAELTRSKRFLSRNAAPIIINKSIPNAAERKPPLNYHLHQQPNQDQPRHHQYHHLGGPVDKMRLNIGVGGETEPETGGRAKDNASWINKYQHSDHHVDRLVRTIVDYESTTGERFPGW